jgi:hypothetical protein
VGFGGVVVILVYVHKCARALKVMICVKPSGREVIYHFKKVDSLPVFLNELTRRFPAICSLKGSRYCLRKEGKWTRDDIIRMQSMIQ